MHERRPLRSRKKEMRVCYQRLEYKEGIGGRSHRVPALAFWMRSNSWESVAQDHVTVSGSLI